MPSEVGTSPKHLNLKDNESPTYIASEIKNMPIMDKYKELEPSPFESREISLTGPTTKNPSV